MVRSAMNLREIGETASTLGVLISAIALIYLILQTRATQQQAKIAVEAVETSAEQHRRRHGAAVSGWLEVEHPDGSDGRWVPVLRLVNHGESVVRSIEVRAWGGDPRIEFVPEFRASYLPPGELGLRHVWREWPSRYGHAKQEQVLAAIEEIEFTLRFVDVDDQIWHRDQKGVLTAAALPPKH